VEAVVSPKTAKFYVPQNLSAIRYIMQVLGRCTWTGFQPPPFYVHTTLISGKSVSDM